MKTLKESLFDQDIDSSEVENAAISKWLDDNYKKIRGKYTVDMNKHEVLCKYEIEVSNFDIEQLLPDGWIFGSPCMRFDCSVCENLKSLKGAPKKVINRFNCSGCTSLKTLDGAPETVTNSFDCSGCTSLESLKGFPDMPHDAYMKVSGCTSLKSLKGLPDTAKGFDCSGCTSLKTLDGAPSQVFGSFTCLDCTSLKTLKGSPKLCDRFNCSGCTSLYSLDGMPEVIRGNMSCERCNIWDYSALNKSYILGEVFR